MAFTFMKKISPEYVIENAIKDVRTSGIEGLKPYLTEDAQNKVERIRSFSSGIDLLTGSNKVSYLSVLLITSKLFSVKYGLVDVCSGCIESNSCSPCEQRQRFKFARFKGVGDKWNQ